MKQTIRSPSKNQWTHKILKSLNLRPEEGERTLLMFAFYTATSVGLLWVEQTAIALFLAPPPEGFGAKWLPIIYIVSAILGSGLGFLYSWLQDNWPLQKVLMTIVLLMALPLLIFRLSLDIRYLNGIIALGAVFALRLWMDAQEILSELNSQVAANQLFNIREIKRSYPIISSGLLVGDVISGFSLPLLLLVIGLNNVIIVAAIMMLVGGGILFYLTQRYKQAFPNKPVRELEQLDADFTNRNISGSLQRYIIPLFAFFILGEVLFLLVEFQYLGELEVNFDTDQIAGFLGLFSGVLGIFELLTQWFVSSRAVERLGVFITAMFLPVSLSILGLITIVVDSNFGVIILDSSQILFLSAITLKFFDELLRYTLIAGIEPFLFQPLAAGIRGSIQTLVQGVAEPISTGVTGIGILAAIALINWNFPNSSQEVMRQLQEIIFVFAIIFFSLIWAASAWFLRSSYVNLLVQEAEQGRLGFTNVNLKAFKRSLLEALAQKKTEADKRSCIQLLARIDPQNAGEILAPLLINLSPVLQHQSLEVMLRYPQPDYRPDIQKLIKRQPPLEVLALALRYIWISDADLDTNNLKSYLSQRIDPLIRGTAACLILERGEKEEKIAARIVIEQMLISSEERERVIGVQSLPEPNHSSLAMVYISDLLQDNSAQVRCALLEGIGSKRLPEYYPSLLRGLYYKSTRESAKKALVSLGNEAASFLVPFAEDIHNPDFIRLQAWSVMAEIGTPEMLDKLVRQLRVSWGTTRRNLLRILLKMPTENGIEVVLDQLGRSGIETFINQELLLLGQIHSAVLDFNPEVIVGQEADLLRASLQGMQADILERCFLLMRLLYSSIAIQAAILNLNSDSQSSIALGLEILDNTIDLPQKQLFLEILDGGLPLKIKQLAPIEMMVSYQNMKLSDRLRRLIDLRHFLSDWSVACCFHLARVKRWNVTRTATLVCLRHPSSFIREAVLAYLKEASPRICLEVLSILKNDPDSLVVAQVEKIKAELSSQISQNT